MRSRLLSTVMAGAAGAAAALLADPQSGRRRRAELAARSGAMARRSSHMAQRTSRMLRSEVEGKSRAAVHAFTGKPRPVANEETLADRVRSELFRDPKVPKGALNINVERECVVVLRGEVQPAMAQTIERRVRAIPGVRDVENLLHPAGTPAPMHGA